MNITILRPVAALLLPVAVAVACGSNESSDDRVSCDTGGDPAYFAVAVPPPYPGCLAVSLVFDEGGRTPCHAFEGTDAETCECDGGRTPIEGRSCDSLNETLQAAGLPERSCFCALPQASGDLMTACQRDADVTSEVAWCLIDRICAKNEAFFQGCAAEARTVLRVIGERPADAVYLYGCVGLEWPYSSTSCPPGL